MVLCLDHGTQIDIDATFPTKLRALVELSCFVLSCHKLTGEMIGHQFCPTSTLGVPFTWEYDGLLAYDRDGIGLFLPRKSEEYI